jgi:hypothetical protein
LNGQTPMDREATATTLATKIAALSAGVFVFNGSVPRCPHTLDLFDDVGEAARGAVGWPGSLGVPGPGQADPSDDLDASSGSVPVPS